MNRLHRTESKSKLLDFVIVLWNNVEARLGEWATSAQPRLGAVRAPGVGRREGVDKSEDG